MISKPHRDFISTIISLKIKFMTKLNFSSFQLNFTNEICNNMLKVFDCTLFHIYITSMQMLNIYLN